MKAVSWLIVVGVVLGGVVVADRVADSLAEGAVQDAIAAQGGRCVGSRVAVNGLPFLTQAVAGVYDDVEVHCDSTQLKNMRGGALDVTLRRVHVSVTKLFNHPDSVYVEHVGGSLLIPYDQLAQASGIDGLRLSADGGRVNLAKTISLPVLGNVTVESVADPELTPEGVHLKVDELRAGGVSVPQVAMPFVSQLLNITIAVRDLPFGLRLTSVAAAPGGGVFSAEASQAVLARR